MEAGRWEWQRSTKSFRGAEQAPAIFTPGQLRRILDACEPEVLPHVAIGAFSAIRTAEIALLDWSEILWERGYIEVKAAKAQTWSRRLVPLHKNLRAWLLPHHKDQGPVVCPRRLWRWLEQTSRKGVRLTDGMLSLSSNGSVVQLKV